MSYTTCVLLANFVTEVAPLRVIHFHWRTHITERYLSKFKLDLG